MVIVSPILADVAERVGTETLAIGSRLILPDAMKLDTYVPDRVAWILNVPLTATLVSVPSSLWMRV